MSKIPQIINSTEKNVCKKIILYTRVRDRTRFSEMDRKTNEILVLKTRQNKLLKRQLFDCWFDDIYLDCLICDYVDDFLVELLVEKRVFGSGKGIVTDF